LGWSTKVGYSILRFLDGISALVACMSALFFLNSVTLLAMCCESRLDNCLLASGLHPNALDSSLYVYVILSYANFMFLYFAL